MKATLVKKLFASGILRYIAFLLVILLMPGDKITLQKAVVFLSPYFAAWISISLLSIFISGMQFKAIWMGTFADNDTYDTPGVYYAIIFLVTILVIYLIQYYSGVI